MDTLLGNIPHAASVSATKSITLARLERFYLGMGIIGM
jgi:hypothetical protein